MEFIQVQQPNGFSEMVILALLVLATIVAGLGTRRRRTGNAFGKRWRNTSTQPRPGNNWGLADPKNQLEAISKVNFERQKLLNTSEARVFAALEGIVAEVGGGYRVMAQTSVGELLKPQSNSGDWKMRKDAYASINSKRFDFAIVDRSGLLALAVEYQGKGHHREKSFMRDAVKREVCRRAGVPFLEVEPGMKPSELRGHVMRMLAPTSARDSGTSELDPGASTPIAT